MPALLVLGLLLHEPEINQLDHERAVRAREHEIRRLQIAMDEASRVAAFQCARDLLGHRDQLLGRDGSIRLQPLREIPARAKFHCIKEPVLDRPEVINLRDVRVPQPGDRLGLGEEPFARLGLREETFADDFDRRRAFQEAVPRQIRLAVRPLAEQPWLSIGRDLDVEIAEPGRECLVFFGDVGRSHGIGRGVSPTAAWVTFQSAS